MIIRRNRFYRGNPPHHLDGFDVDLRVGSPSEALDQVEAGKRTGRCVVADPLRARARARGEVRRQQGEVLRAARARTQAHRLQQRPTALPRQRATPAGRQLRTEPKGASASRDDGAARISPHRPIPATEPAWDTATPSCIHWSGPILPRANALARGSLRGGKALLYVNNAPQPLAVAQTAKRQLAEIGLDVESKPLAGAALQRALYTPGEPWDIIFGLWSPTTSTPSSTSTSCSIRGIASSAISGG